MKIKIIGISIALTILISACVSIPKETVTLSQTLGKDLQILHNSHRNMVQLYYGKIKDNIYVFIDEVYAPYIINSMLNAELQSYKSGNPSLYKSRRRRRKISHTKSYGRGYELYARLSGDSQITDC